MKSTNTFKKFVSLAILFTVSLVFANGANAQDRARVVKNKKQKTRPTTQLPASPRSKSGTLTNEIVVRKKESPRSLVRRTSKTSARKPVKRSGVRTTKAPSRNAYSATTQSMMLRSIQNKIGIRYRLGTQGPRSYDCSGFVWKVFQESGIPFTRTSARWFYKKFEPVYGDDRYEFGTLVFLNKLGHVGIVADRNGFYHASSSRGVMYSKFAGYWSKRIVGFRRVPAPNYSWKDSIEKQKERN